MQTNESLDQMLPFDIWIYTTQFITIKDFSSLMYSSKYISIHFPCTLTIQVYRQELSILRRISWQKDFGNVILCDPNKITNSDFLYIAMNRQLTLIVYHLANKLGLP
jgi:hypothetical protein